MSADIPDGPETSVRVAVRIRPQISRELLDMCQVCTSVTPGEPQVWLGKDKAFTYDYVFDIDSKQTEIYDTCVRNLVEGCFSGYNATVLAYGQTGSGKTYTMGTGFDPTTSRDYQQELDDSQGIVVRAVHHLFDGVAKRRNEAQESNKLPPEFKITAQFLELYNEDIIDLLDESRSINNNKQIKIQQDNGKIQMAGVTSRPVDSINEAFECLRVGALSRSTASTQMNTQSSRSHAIFSLFINQTRVACEAQDVETLSAKFHFVDLAGSERLKRTGATGERAKEGISINTGLLCLGNVISALGDKSKKATHVPYRDSKLTRLLQDSLGGNSQTLMIACISPSDRDFMETLSTLRYANRAKNIVNKVMVNHDTSRHTIALLRKEIEELKLELSELKQGKRMIGDDGNEYINDLYHENEMLMAEIRTLKARNKVSQEADGDVDVSDSSEDISEDSTIEKAELELVQLNDDISTKELLIAELEKSQRKMESLKHHYESKLIQLQNQIAEIEKERDEVLIKLTQGGNKIDEKAKKIHEDYDKKIKALQGDLKKLQDARKEHALAMKNQARFEQQVKKLRNEVSEMKRQKVNVMTKMKEEASRHRVSELQSNKRIAQLIKQDRLKDVRIKNLEVENNRLKLALKRKDAEIKALKTKNRNVPSRLLRQSPKQAKNKCADIEHEINQIIATRQALWNLDQQMNRNIAQRQDLSEQLDEVHKRLCEAKHLNDHDAERVFTDDIETIKSNIFYLDQNIRDIQSRIIQLEDDITLEPPVPAMPPPSSCGKARRVTRTPQELLFPSREPSYDHFF